MLGRPKLLLWSGTKNQVSSIDLITYRAIILAEEGGGFLLIPKTLEIVMLKKM